MTTATTDPTYEDSKIRKGVPAWVLALVAVACLFWGGVAGAVIAVVAGDGIDLGLDGLNGQGHDDVVEEDLLTVGPGGRIEAIDAQPGACFDGTVNPDTGRVTKLGAPSDCHDSHKVEVFAVLDAPVAQTDDASLYQPDEIDYFAFDACLLNFRDYVGQHYDDSDLEVSSLVPSPAAWTAGSRRVTCLLHHPDNTALTSPLKFLR